MPFIYSISRIHLNLQRIAPQSYKKNPTFANFHAILWDFFHFSIFD